MKKTNKVTHLIGVLALSLTLPATAQDKETPQPKVQIALLLDTSGSMNGLIDQAKTQLWKIVNSFAKVEKDEQAPKIEVALYQYGNSNLVSTSNYIQKISPLTQELDDISEALYSLTTSGGEEYCGAAISHSINNLDWDSSSEVYKAIFIAGNEPFTQGPVSATLSCQQAIQKGIVVNSIHCGTENDGLTGGWKAGALAAEGDFLVINQDKAVVHIEAPQDQIIIKLSTELNKTYIPYGKKGKARQLNQALQDQNAAQFEDSGASIQRALTKNSPSAYTNTSWDLVDYCNNCHYNLGEVNTDELPEELKGLSEEEIKAHVKSIDKKRVAIQEEINKLNAERTAYLAEATKTSATEAGDTLDLAITKAIQKQISKNGFTTKR